MEAAVDAAALWLARAAASYVVFVLLFGSFFLVHLCLLAAAVWTLACRRLVPHPLRLAVDLIYGLFHPALYLAVLSSSLPLLCPGLHAWSLVLHALAWLLLAAFWILRLFGSAAPLSRAFTHALLLLSLACLTAFFLKDASILFAEARATGSWTPVPLLLVMLGPLYLLPAVLLSDYLRSVGPARLFLLPHRAARRALAAAAAVALIWIAAAAQARSDSSARRLLRAHRAPILAAAARYDIDPRLLASIVYVTQRHQLTPFRDATERLAVQAWAWNLRRDFHQRPPDTLGEGADENPLFNLPLDLSVGLAQVKPRTALTASLLASGRTPEQLARSIFFHYIDAEPAGPAWNLSAVPLPAPLPVPAARGVVAQSLLNPASNLDTAALILALYQRQWETANRAWTLRQRPDVLATLYSLGFARSRPHAAPRTNSFGLLVTRIMAQPWLAAALQP